MLGHGACEHCKEKEDGDEAVSFLPKRKGLGFRVAASEKERSYRTLAKGRFMKP